VHGRVSDLTSAEAPRRSSDSNLEVTGTGGPGNEQKIMIGERLSAAA
jgi:hypothetical protein